MNAKINRTIFLSSLTLIIIAFSGCKSGSAKKQHYLLETQRFTSGQALNSQNILDVHRFSIDSAFGDKGLTYRTGQFEFETDYYNEFLISPAEMLTEKTRKWLSDSGLFRIIPQQGSLIEPTHMLEANINSFYGDYTDKESPKAVMEIQFFLLETKEWQEPEIIFSKSYKSQKSIQDGGSAEVVKAMDACLTEILTSLERNIADKL